MGLLLVFAVAQIGWSIEEPRQGKSRLELLQSEQRPPCQRETSPLNEFADMFYISHEHIILILPDTYFSPRVPRVLLPLQQSLTDFQCLDDDLLIFLIGEEVLHQSRKAVLYACLSHGTHYRMSQRIRSLDTAAC